jgi:hypothetical protein
MERQRSALVLIAGRAARRRERGSPDPLNVEPELPFGCVDQEIHTYSQRLWKAALLSLRLRRSNSLSQNRPT